MGEIIPMDENGTFFNLSFQCALLKKICYLVWIFFLYFSVFEAPWSLPARNVNVLSLSLLHHRYFSMKLQTGWKLPYLKIGCSHDEICHATSNTLKALKAWNGWNFPILDGTICCDYRGIPELKNISNFCSISES